MLCDTCRFSERPGFVRARGRAHGEGQRNRDEMIPCPDCGGQGIGHCCDGICEQPEATPRPSLGTASVGATSLGAARER